jgi:hypothetical protein
MTIAAMKPHRTRAKLRYALDQNPWLRTRGRNAWRTEEAEGSWATIGNETPVH